MITKLIQSEYAISMVVGASHEEQNKLLWNLYILTKFRQKNCIRNLISIFLNYYCVPENIQPYWPGHYSQILEFKYSVPKPNSGSQMFVSILYAISYQRIIYISFIIPNSQETMICQYLTSSILNWSIVHLNSE